MDIQNVRLSKHQIQNILLFLDRVEIKGINESIALIEIVQTLRQQTEEKKEKQ